MGWKNDDDSAAFLIRHLPLSEVMAYIVARQELRIMTGAPLEPWIEPDPSADDPDGTRSTIPVIRAPLRSGSRRRRGSVRRAIRGAK